MKRIERKINLPAIGNHLPRRFSWILSNVGSLILLLFGWRFKGNLPNLPKCVVIFAPHTSNWDFVFGMATIFALQVNAEWLGKHTIFKWPFESLTRWIGGIPVDRRSSYAMVDQMIQEFSERKQLLLVLAPEGTRSEAQRWKSGFYHIANGSQTPIMMAFLDYGTHCISFSRLIYPSGDYEADLAQIQALSSKHSGKRPQADSLRWHR